MTKMGFKKLSNDFDVKVKGGNHEKGSDMPSFSEMQEGVHDYSGKNLAKRVFTSEGGLFG